MSVESQEFICDNCRSEIVIDFVQNEDIVEEDIRFCCFCGERYGRMVVNFDDMDMENLSDDYSEFDE